ncbi:MAG: hypothetical protein ACP5PB_06530 [Acidimicrobiales bacterium]
MTSHQQTNHTIQSHRPDLGAARRSPDVLTQLRVDWRRSGRCAASRRALAHLASRRPELDLARLDDLGDVVDALDVRGGRSVLERAALVTALLEDAGDPIVHRALLQTLLPGLVSVCRQLRFGAGAVADTGETVAVAVAMLSELLTDWAGQSRTYAAPDLLSALRGRLRRWLMKEKRERGLVTPLERLDRAAPAVSTLDARLATFQGGDRDRIARLAYRRIVGDESLADLAREDHCSPRSLRAELQHFAVHCLL